MDPELEAFTRLLRAPEPEIDLVRAALAVARVEYPTLDPDRSIRRLDDLARRSGASAGARGIERLRRFLFEEEGFRGNAEEYYDPRNSCLNAVLDRRLGNPITLSVVMMEVGRRVGVPLAGIGLPGHFVVGAEVDGAPVLLDPFNGGAVLTRDGAGEVVARALGRRVELAADHFTPCTRRQIVVRMLRNLKSVYAKQEAWDKLLAIVDRLLVVDEDAPVHRRDRGTVLVKLGRVQEGADEWYRYLARYPHVADAESFRRELQRVNQELASRN